MIDSPYLLVLVPFGIGLCWVTVFLALLKWHYPNPREVADPNPDADDEQYVFVDPATTEPTPLRGWRLVEVLMLCYHWPVLVPFMLRKRPVLPGPVKIIPLAASLYGGIIALVIFLFS
jgi:hypothetical protein